MKTRATVEAIAAAQAANRVDVNRAQPLSPNGSGGGRDSSTLSVSARMRREKRTATRLQGLNFAGKTGVFDQESSPPATAGTVAAARPLLAGASRVGTKCLGFQQQGSSAAVV
jgi:hypothetical protein